MTDYWDETSTEVSDMMGNAGLIDGAEAMPYPGSFWASRGDNWTYFQAKDFGGVTVLVMTAGLRAQVPASEQLLAKINERTSGFPLGAFFADINEDNGRSFVLFRTQVPLDLLREPNSVRGFAQQLVFTSLTIHDEVVPVFDAFGGSFFSEDPSYRSYLAAIL